MRVKEITSKKTRDGFTLIELLVVVAVLALLASIVFSNLKGAREGARISNALSFQSQMHNRLGVDIVGRWNFDDNLNDTSSYENNGTWGGSVSPTYVDGVSGTLGKAIDVSGGNHYVNIVHDTTQLLTTGGTISAWINPYGLGGSDYGRIVDKSTGIGGNDGYSFHLAPDNKLRFSIHATNRESATDSISLDSWTHVIVTWTINGTVTFYVNGEVSGTPGLTGNPSLITTTNPLRIGIRSNATDYGFNGLIDDVRLYTRNFTGQEAQTIYAQTKDRYLAGE